MIRKMVRKIILPILVAFIGIGFLWQATDSFRAITAEGSRRINIAENPRQVPPFILEDMTGNRIILPPQDHTIMLVEFIYTTCPDICQVAGNNFAKLHNRLLELNLPVRLLSISFDPIHDELEELSLYAKIHNADGRNWTIARPLKRDLTPLLTLFDVTVIANEWGGYEHNVAIHLIDAEGKLAALYDINAIDKVLHDIKERLG